MSYLDFYKECSKEGKLPDWGLCLSVDLSDAEKGLFELIKPSDEEEYELYEKKLCHIYWGSGLSVYDDLNKKKYLLTPLRENLILLLACLNGEL